MYVCKSRPDGGRNAGLRIAFFCAIGSAVGIVAAVGCSEGGQPRSEAIASAKQPLVPGTWTKITAPYPTGGGPSHLQLLMDGSILANDGNTVWRRFIPDPVSGYVGGTWVTAAPTVYERVYFATGMLLDGRYLVCGGEYMKLNTVPLTGNRSKCELYDPKTNYPTGAWTSVTDYPVDVGDGLMTSRPDGTLLVAGLGDRTLRAFNPNVSPATWTNVGTMPATMATFNEGTITRLQNGNHVFFRDGASVYTVATQTWGARVAPPANNPFGEVFCPVTGSPDADVCSVEAAPALTLYDGRVFVAGATGFNGLFNPANNGFVNVANTPGVTNNIQRWRPNPPSPKTNLGVGSIGARMDENDQAVLPNGNVLAAVIRWDFGGPYKFYEYTPPTTSVPLGAFTDVSAGGPSYVAANLLQSPLPDGTMLVANAGNPNLYVYRHAGAQLTTFGQPTITNVTGPVAGVYTLTGTTLNGLTNGASRDDEGQNDTAFPIVWVNVHGQRRYCNVTSVSTASIAPGTAATVKFTLPGNMPHGTFTVGVAASGLQSSNTFSITYGVRENLSGQRGLLLLE